MRRTLSALSLCMLLPSVAVSIANVGLPTLATAFDAPVHRVQWVVIAYLLAVTTLIVGAGRLGDLLGRRRLLTAGVAVFTLATLLCGLAPNLPVLIAARALQGLGAAGMLALTMALVGETVPKDRTGSAMGLLGTMSAAGTALGPSLGGALIALGGWRAIFLGVVPLGLLALALTRRLPAGGRAPTGAGRFDTAGTALLALTLGAYALSVTLDPLSPSSLGLLAVCAAGLAAFVAVERRVAAPLVSLPMLGDPALVAGLSTSAGVSAVLMTTLVVGPFHLTWALGLDPAAVGLVMSAGPVVSALAGVPAGRATDRFGAQPVVIAGLGGVLAGTVLLATVPASAGVLGYLLPLIVVTGGYALFQAANNASVLRDVAADRRGVVSGLLNLSRNVGLLTGASVMGAVFVHFGAGERGTHRTFAVAALLVAGCLLLVLRPRTRPAAELPSRLSGSSPGS